MKLGVFVTLNGQIGGEFKKLKEHGFSTCQLCSWQPDQMTPEAAALAKSAAAEYGIEITAFWCGWSGPAVWDFYQGPLTLGLVPEAFRYARMRELQAGSDFARLLGVTDLITHVGFLPENPSSTEYAGVISAIQAVASHCLKNGQRFLFETGQETPVTLKRTIEDVGTGNLGVNLDPANLVLYGKANPVDALEVFGEYVRGIHGKDGCYPTGGRHLGRETPIGQGRVNFPALLKKLKSIGYDGAITIEREITGKQQTEDILTAKGYLERLLSEL